MCERILSLQESIACTESPPVGWGPLPMRCATLAAACKKKKKTNGVGDLAGATGTHLAAHFGIAHFLWRPAVAHGCQARDAKSCSTATSRVDHTPPLSRWQPTQQPRCQERQKRRGAERTLPVACRTSAAESSIIGDSAGTTRAATSCAVWYAAVAISALSAAMRDGAKTSRSARVNALSRIRLHAAAPSLSLIHI